MKIGNVLLGALVAAIVVGTGLVGPEPVRADCTTTTCRGSVTRLIVTQTGIQLRLADADVPQAEFNELICADLTSRYFWVPASAATFREVFSLLMGMYLAGRQVSVRIVDNSATCEVAYAFTE